MSITIASVSVSNFGNNGYIFHAVGTEPNPPASLRMVVVLENGGMTSVSSLIAGGIETRDQSVEIKCKRLSVEIKCGD